MKRPGVYEGIGPLSREEVRHRMASLKFSSRHGKVEKVEVVNAADHLTNPISCPRSAWTGDYLIDERKSHIAGDDSGMSYIPARRPRRASGSSSATPRTMSSTRQPATRPVGSSTACYGLLYVPTGRPTEATAFYIDRNGFPQARSGSGAAYVKIVRSEQGFDREIRYFDIKGNPQLDEKGCLGRPGDRSEDRSSSSASPTWAPTGRRPMLRTESTSRAT